MRSTTAFNKQRSAILSINDLIGSAICFHMTSREITERFLKITASLDKCPQHVRAYVGGYWEAKREDMVRVHIVHGTWHDGVFCSTHKARADYAEKMPGFTTWEAYSKLPGKSGMYWGDKPERVFWEQDQ